MMLTAQLYIQGRYWTSSLLPPQQATMSFEELEKAFDEWADSFPTNPSLARRSLSRELICRRVLERVHPPCGE